MSASIDTSRSPRRRRPRRGRPRILHVITDLKVGGESRHLAAVIAALPEFDHSVACLARTLDPENAAHEVSAELSASGAEVVDLEVRRESGKTLVAGAIRLSRLIAKMKPALVHSTLVHANIATLAVAPVETPVVATLVSVRPWTARWQPPVHRLLARRAAIVLVNSRAVADVVAASGGADRTRIRCLGYGVDVERFSPEGKLADLGDRPVVLGIGRLVDHKGFEDLIAAAAALNRRPHVVLLGEGPSALRLRESAGRLGVDLTLVGVVDDVAPYLRRADVVAFPSHWEGIPNALLEALATARPVVTTATGGVTDVVRDREHALLVPIGDQQALAEALEAGLGGAAEMARRGRELVIKRHSWPAYVQRRRLLYESVARCPHLPVKR